MLNFLELKASEDGMQVHNLQNSEVPPLSVTGPRMGAAHPATQLFFPLPRLLVSPFISLSEDDFYLQIQNSSYQIHVCPRSGPVLGLSMSHSPLIWDLLKDSPG